MEAVPKREEPMVKLSWRRITAVVALAGMVVLPACGGEGPGQYTRGGGSGRITIWAHQGQEGEVQALQRAVKDFNASQSGVHADLQFIPEADYPKTVAVTKPSALPDVLEFDGTLTSTLVYSYKLAPLKGLVAPKTITNQTASVISENTYPGDG